MIPSLATGQFLNRFKVFCYEEKLVQCKQYPVFVTERAHISWLIQLGPAIAPLPEKIHCQQMKKVLSGAVRQRTYLTLECLFS